MTIIGLAEVAIAPEVSSFASDLKSKIGEAMKNPIAVAGAAVAAAGATVGAFAKTSIDKFEEVGGEVKQLTKLTGGSAESMSRLRFAAQETGVSTDKLGAGIRKLSVDITKHGSDLDKLGIKYKDAKGNLLPVDQTLGNVAQKFKTMPNGIEKNALAIQLFGKSGTDLLPILNKGKDGLADLGAEADKFGLTLTQNNLDAIQRNIQAHREFSAAMDGLKVQLGAQLLPVLTSVAEFFNSVAIPFITTVTDDVNTKLGPAFTTLKGYVSDAYTQLTNGFKDADPSQNIQAVGTVFTTFGSDLKTLWSDLTIAWGSFVDGFKDNSAVGDEVGGLATTFAAVGVVVRDSLAALRDLITFLVDHQQAVKDVTLTVLGLKTAYEGWQLGKKTIDFAVSGVDKVMGAIDSISGALGKIGSKTIDIAAKATGGAAQGAGSAAGGAGAGQVGNIVSGAAGGALGNFFDLKALLPKLKIFAGGIVTSLGEYLIAGAGALEGVGAAIAAIIFTPEVLIAAVIAAVGLIAFHFRDGIINFFTTDLPNAIGQLPSLAGWLVDKGLELVQGLLEGIGQGLLFVLDSVAHIPDNIFYSIGYLGGTLFSVGKDLLQGLWDGATFVFELVKGWVTDIPNQVTSLLNLLDTLYQKGQDLLQGLWRGVTDLFTGSIAPWFTALPGEIVTAIGDVTQTLTKIGSDIIGGLWSAVQLAWHDPKQFFIDLAVAVPAAVGFAGRWLYQHGKDIIQGLKEGIENLYDSAISKFRDLRGNVLGAVTGAASWLYQAGADVIRGLLNGIGDLYGSVVSKMHSLGGDIIKGFKDAAGIKSPSVHMHESGFQLVAGLANGITAAKSLATDAIADVANSVLDPFGGQGLAMASGGRMGAGKVVSIGAIHIANNKTLQENLDEIDRLYPVIPA